ncbi:Hypothetical protein PHPALM_20457 [Phytophthora palmivora]|uniref:Chromo domain-containing protein n=1 Tax=Phytophthora palmivora TaxID=4796 RepID=A0A2P4XEU7_9STRA|nr:Hypothetical protein PHPALM_20457 [Phytophthora palmivora]
MSPFEADLGYVPRNPLTAVAASSRRGLRGGRQQRTKFTEHQEAVLRQCQEALEDAQARMADVYDRGRPKWIGPYSVVRTVHKHAYELNLPPGLKLHPVFNTGSLKPYEKTSRLSRPQDVILRDGKVGQLVEAIVDKSKRKGAVQYLIRCVGEAKATWEPLENLHQVTDLIQAYEEKRPKRSRKRRRTRQEYDNVSDRTRHRLKSRT